LCAELFVYTADKPEKKIRVKPLVTPAITMLVDIPEDKEDRAFSLTDSLDLKDISSRNFPFHDTLTSQNFGDKLDASDPYENKEVFSSDPLVRVQLPGGRTARCVLNAFCTAAEFDDIEQKLQECRKCIRHLQKNNPERLDLFIQELKNARVYVAGRLALRVGDISRQRDEMVERLTSVLTPRSEFSEEEYKIFKANLYHQLEAYHQSMQAQRRAKKHCPGCCSGCDVL
jgi:hypothetical protein